MTPFLHLHFSTPLVFIILTLTTPLWSQESAYRTVDVSKKLSISVPAHWHIRDLAERRNIAASAEAITSGPVYVSSLSVVSQPEPIGVITRITFVPAALTQKQVRDAISADRAGFLMGLISTFNQELDSQKEGFKNENITVLGAASSGIDSVGGMLALTLKYRRTSLIEQSPFTVAQYHIPLGQEKAIITFSYRESEQKLFLPIIERMKRSIVFKWPSKQ